MILWHRLMYKLFKRIPSKGMMSEEERMAQLREIIPTMKS